MAAKLVLPRLGGAPAVWNGCMLFFQLVLLLGYLYAHRLHRFAPRKQAAGHIVLLAASIRADRPCRARRRTTGAAGRTLRVLAARPATAAIVVRAGAFGKYSSFPAGRRWPPISSANRTCAHT